jgi:hypothetical protein
MPTKRTLRLLVIAELLLILTGVVTAIMESSLPETWRLYQELRTVGDFTSESETAVEPAEESLVSEVAEEPGTEGSFTMRDWMTIGIGIPLVIALLASSIGLFFFRPFARPLYLATTLGSILIVPLYGGPYVVSGWMQTLDDIGLILSGVILATIYWSPLKELFEKRRESSA